MSKQKSNRSDSTSLSDNSIQNAGGLTKVDNHNYRKYDNQQENIDLDKVKYIYKHSDNQLLPNSIDLRNSFEVVGMPKRIWPSSVQSDPENRKKVEFVIS